MKKFKKTLCIFMGLIMTLCAFSACSKDNESALSASDLVKPTYEDNFELMIWGDHELDADERTLTIYKEAGFNTYNYYPSSTAVSKIKSAADVCEKMGLDMIIFGGSPLKWATEGNANVAATYPDRIGYFPNYFAKFDKAGVDFYDMPAIKGFYFIDEPGATLFDDMKDTYVKWFNEKYPDLLWHVNMLPSYATPDLIEVENTGGDKPIFEEYIERYAEEVIKHVTGNKKDIGVDHYPLMKSGYNTYVSTEYLYDLMVVSQVAHDYGVDFASCIQAAGWGPYRVPDKAEDIRFQVYTNLALGARRLEFYPYNTSGYDGYTGMYAFGSPSATYDAVQEVLLEVTKFDYLFGHFNWEGLKTITGKKQIEDVDMGFDLIQDRVLSSLKGIKSASSTYDSIIGQFEDKDGNKAYMLVNYTDPAHGHLNKIDLEFNNAKGVVMYREGIEMVLTTTNNKLSVPLEPGEGVFIIPITEVAG